MTSTLPVPSLANLSSIRIEIRALLPEFVQWRRQIHQNPELGFQEDMTAQFIAKKLEAWDIEHQTGIAKTGIVASIQGKKVVEEAQKAKSDQKSITVLAIRADMDALPIQEENIVSYRSQYDGVMHACGHDGHIAIALGTAYYLATHREDFAGVVKFIFQPAEESPGGAKPMIDEGVLKNPDVEAIIGLHLWNSLPLGIVGIRSGPLMAASDSFHCTIYGRGGHGGMPHKTIDSILVSIQVINALQTIIARNIDPLESAVITIGQFNAGTALNVIAEKASFSGTVRYFNPALQSFINERIKQVISGICESHGASYSLDYWQLCPSVINDKKITELVRSIAESVMGDPDRIVQNCQTMGGEDMSFFLQSVPGCYFFLGSANPDTGLTYPHHHPRFNFDETALALGVEIFVRCVEEMCKGI